MVSSIAFEDFKACQIFKGFDFRREYEIEEDLTGVAAGDISAVFVDDLSTPTTVFTATGGVISTGSVSEFFIEVPSASTGAQTPVLVSNQTKPGETLRQQFQRLAFFVSIRGMVKVFGVAEFYNTGQ